MTYHPLNANTILPKKEDQTKWYATEREISQIYYSINLLQVHSEKEKINGVNVLFAEPAIQAMRHRLSELFYERIKLRKEKRMDELQIPEASNKKTK